MKGRVYTHGEPQGVSVARHQNLGIEQVATLVNLSHAYCDDGACRASADVGDLDGWRMFLRGSGWSFSSFTEVGSLPPGRLDDWDLLKLHDGESHVPPLCRASIMHNANGYYRSSWVDTFIPCPGEALTYVRAK